MTSSCCVFGSICLEYYLRFLRGSVAPGVAGTCKHEIIILVVSVSAHLVNATIEKHCFYNALALNALPVPLLRQVFFRYL